mmetsp:Transcript_5412/g.11952  ORF Transcript_5412/g.11952 Transcript_5412/m.11952 type:complete len:82 (+) Transcript_5412:633-878(+)
MAAQLLLLTALPGMQVCPLVRGPARHRPTPPSWAHGRLMPVVTLPFKACSIHMDTMPLLPATSRQFLHSQGHMASCLLGVS